MKTNKPHILLLLALTAVFTCCSGDDYSDINTSGSPDGGSSTAPFTITVTDGGYASLSGGASTRASEANYKTIFTEGDQIGVFAVKDGEIVDEVNNLHLCYTDRDNDTNLSYPAWIDASGNPPANIKGATYYAYYPYQENLNSKLLDPYAEDAADFFAGVISEWSPAEHQSTYADYTAQDLMIAKGDANFTEKSLSFTMSHQMALVVMDLPRIEYTFTNLYPSIPNYVTNTSNADFEDIGPCRMEDGTYRYLMNPSKTKDALFSGSYTSAHGLTTWKVPTNAIAAGKYQIIEVDGGCRKLEHELAIGDFFMKDGTLIAGSTQSLTPDQQAACIGIVFWVGDATVEDQTLQSKHSNCTHGLVVALNDAADAIVWQALEEYEPVQNWLNNNRWDIYLPVASGLGINDPLNNIQGYNNTKAIEEFNDGNAGNLVQAVSTVVAYRNNVSAPNTSSDWYLPSAKELTLLCGEDVDDIYFSIDIGTANKDLINNKIGLIGDGATKISSADCWSSTERSYYSAFSVYFGGGYVSGDDKDLTYRVRCVLAF